MTVSPIAEIKRAKKRCVSMGVERPDEAAFDRHPLAAIIANYSSVINVELDGGMPDYICILSWIHIMAQAINAYCDANHVADDKSAQYWLAQFLKVCDSACKIDLLSE